MTVQGPTGGARSSPYTRSPTDPRPSDATPTRSTPGQTPSRTQDAVALRNQDSFTRAPRPQGPDLTGASRQTPLPQTNTVALSSSQSVNAVTSGGQTSETRKVDVPVFAGDTQWDVVTRSLPLLAKQAGLGAEGQKVFAEKWATQLEEAGQTSIYVNKTGQTVGNEDFLAGVNKDNANPGTGSIGTYRLEFTPQKHTEMLADLQRLRQTESLASGIQDPQLRREVLLGLNEMMVGSTDERASASQRLGQLAQLGMPEADKVQQAIMNLADRPELQFDPIVQMTALRVEVDRQAQLVGPPDPARIESLRQRALEVVEYAEKSDFGGEVIYGSQSQANRGEAAWVNKQVSRALDQLGDKQGAQYREMIGRFYEVDPSERQKYESGMYTSIERWKNDGQTYMRGVTKEEQALRKFEEQNGKVDQPKKDLAEDPQKREYKGRKYVMQEDGRLQRMPEQVFQQEGALKTEGVMQGTRQSPVSRRPQAPFESPNMNQRGSGRAMGVAGGVGLIEEVNKWGSFLGDLVNNTTANKIATRARLEQAAKNATTFPVPPKPERLPMIRQQMTAQFGPEKAEVMMRRLEEMSHAFYGR